MSFDMASEALILGTLTARQEQLMNAFLLTNAGERNLAVINKKWREFTDQTRFESTPSKAEKDTP